MRNLEILTTGDGSHTLKNIQLNETYHSVHGAVQESTHVFIKNGLEFFRNNNEQGPITILEVGFGTGLNALLTLQYALAHRVHVLYTALEPFPITSDVWKNLNYGTDAGRYFEALHEASWDTAVSIASGFTLLKKLTPLQDVPLESDFDIVYFDAFAPSVQPELWTLPVLEKVTTSMRGGGVFVTYSAKGQLKRDLKQLGLNVETLPGPPGKNEMVRANKSASPHEVNSEC